MRRLLSTLTLVAALSACTSEPQVVAAAPPPTDPCQPATYNAPLCQQAVASHGYYWYGHFYPVLYPYPFGFYSNRSVIYIRGGGRVRVLSGGGVYSRTYVRSGGSSFGRSSFGGSSGTARGGFGGTGAGRTSGFGGGFGG